MSKTHRPVIELNKSGDVTPSKIDVIKNLIFGEQIEAYDIEFEKLKEDILTKKKALEELLEEARTDLTQAIDTVTTDVNIRITELEENLENRIESIQTDKVDKETLGQLLIELGKKIAKE